MKARPILFSGAMVRALLEGRKTQTRRIVKPSPADIVTMIGADNLPNGEFGLVLDAECLRVIQKTVRCPYGVPGDLLWAREAWTSVPTSAYRMSEGVQQTVNSGDPDMAAIYAAGWDRSIPKWRPSIHMPRWANRLTLTVENVRAERLQDISEADALAEGISEFPDGYHWQPNQGWPGEPAGQKSARLVGQTARQAYFGLWEAINGRASLDANPWVWAVTAPPIKMNVDAILKAREAA